MSKTLIEHEGEYAATSFCGPKRGDKTDPRQIQLTLSGEYVTLIPERVIELRDALNAWLVKVRRLPKTAIYVVLQPWDYSSAEIKGVYRVHEDAQERLNQVKVDYDNGDHATIEEWEVE